MAAGGLRARVRAEMLGEILVAGREELAANGPAALSLRAVARRMEVVPSALYRYVNSRDGLLTALIVGAYDALGEVARAAAGAGGDPWDRWVAVASAVRDHSSAQPQEWALVFGSPVPGYVGTDATTEAALRLHLVPLGVVADAHRAGRLGAPSVGAGAGVEAAAPAAALLPGVPVAVVAAAMAGWTQVLGHVSLERFGHFVGAVDDLDAYFSTVLAWAAAPAGLGPLARDPADPGSPPALQT